MIIGFVRFENLVKAFEQEGPELVKRAVITDTVWCMHTIVMIGRNNGGAIELNEDLVRATFQYRAEGAYLHKFHAVGSQKGISTYKVFFCNGS